MLISGDAIIIRNETTNPEEDKLHVVLRLKHDGFSRLLHPFLRAKEYCHT